MTRLFPIVVAALAIFTGCNRQSHEVTDFFPLQVGHDWVYEVTNAQKQVSTLEFHILEEAKGDRGEQRFFLDEAKSRYYVKHGDVIAYSVSPEIWTVFLSGPLRKGSKFDGGLAVDFMEATPAPSAAPLEMRTVKSAGYKLVTATNRKITVPAGTFEDCLEVTHLAGATTGVKYFAPGIGMVFAEAYFDNPRDKTHNLVTRQQLAYYRVGNKQGGTMPVRTPAGMPVDTPVDTPVPLVTTTSTPQ